MREFTPLAVFLGIVIGVVFGAANAYIGLKIGMTVSASIPAAVISMAVLRGLLKRGTLLENNMVQTIGSVGESLAAGMIFTIPALFIFAYTEKTPSMAPSIWEMTVWGALGGLLGVFFMVPLRRILIVKEHGKLPYPEGTACAEVLHAGQEGGVSAKTVFWGIGVAGIYEFLRGLGLWAETAKQRLPLIKTEFQLAAEPALLGVGYILGIRVAGYMLAGAVLGWFVIIPAIAMFGAGTALPIFPEQASALAEMSPDDLWNRYLRYIGAGAVVLGGLISLFKSLGTIGGSIFHIFGGGGTGQRTDRDIPTFLLLFGIVGLGLIMWFLPDVAWGNIKNLLDPLFKNITVIACVIAFGFFFATVSSRLVGVVGSSSNPASGMTIATLLGTALIIVNTMDLDPTIAKVAIISVGALVCVCICIAGDTSQDLKTGYLVKATPWKQQMGQMIGVLTATAALAWVIGTIDDRFGFFKDALHPNAVLAPQANLMKLLVQGVVDSNLPWELIFMGVAAALIVELLGIPSLPFAVGLYLPISLSTPIMVGGLLRWMIDKRRKPKSVKHDPGILAASGLVAGQGLVGVMFIGVAAFIGWSWGNPRFSPPEYDQPTQQWVSASQPAAATDQTELAITDATTAQPATQPADASTDPYVVPRDFYPWLTKRIGFLQPEFGLRPHRTERGSFRGDYAIDWWLLLPLVPFGLLALWLAFAASQRPPPPTVPGAPKSAVPSPMPLEPVPLAAASDLPTIGTGSSGTVPADPSGESGILLRPPNDDATPTMDESKKESDETDEPKKDSPQDSD